VIDYNNAPLKPEITHNNTHMCTYTYISEIFLTLSDVPCSMTQN